jgi:1-pyrroline-4-hydroxy-2-carboxylate deaminase
MVLEGHDAYRPQLNPTDALSASERTFTETQHALFKRWYADWSLLNA